MSKLYTPTDTDKSNPADPLNDVIYLTLGHEYSDLIEEANLEYKHKEAYLIDYTILVILGNAVRDVTGRYGRNMMYELNHSYFESDGYDYASNNHIQYMVDFETKLVRIFERLRYKQATHEDFTTEYVSD